jgi:hypothetical protein
VSPHDYEFLCKLLKDQSGLALAGDKQYLLESRLLPLARKAGLASLADLVAKLKDGELLADAVRRALEAARSLAIFAVVVDAKDEKSAVFYRDFGFAPFPSRPLRLFMPASDAVEASRARSR